MIYNNSYYRLIPILLRGMKYSPVDIALLRSDLIDESIPDKESDVRPFIHRGKLHIADKDEGEEEEDEEEYREEVLSDWNLRK